MKHYQESRKETLRHILNLSGRVGRYSVPMKPFIRFSKQAEELYESTPETKDLFWDFDDTLQKILFKIASTVATPEDISDLSIERWKDNLDSLASRKKSQLQDLIETGTEPPLHSTPRDQFILSRLPAGSRFLYIGCGTGTECIRFAQEDLDVVGIDTSAELVHIADEWAHHLKLPYRVLCMDVMHLGFRPRAFDSFLLEFYGFQPSPDQAQSLQRNLASALDEQGLGFVVAARKKYASVLYRKTHRDSGPMTKWLRSQSQLDFLYSQPDGSEERFISGLYNKSHTVDTLSAELQGMFDVLECKYEEYDQRYVIAVVKCKKSANALRPDREDVQPESPSPEVIEHDLATFRATLLEKIESICQILESHQESVSQFFAAPEHHRGNNPLLTIDTELPKFIELLTEIFGIALGNKSDKELCIPSSP